MIATGRCPFVFCIITSCALAAHAGLVAHYDFENGANDSSGNHLNGRLANGAAIVVDSERGQVLDLNGTRSYVDCGNASAFNITGRITVAAWLKIDTVPTSWTTIVAKGDSAWRLSTFQDARQFHFGITGAPDWHSVDGNRQVAADQWHHVCGTYDGAQMRLYVDGVLDAIKGYRGGISTNNFRVYIGENAEVTGRRWDGRIDEVRLYNHALTTAEVAALATAAEEDDGNDDDPNDGPGPWGRLANPGFQAQTIKATLFFPGQARDGTRAYECNAGPNLFLYTIHPSDERHLDWATSAANRTFVIDQMTDAGLNLIAMSSWGEDFLPCSTAWTPSAPMQCSPQAHDELFAAVTDKPMLIMPFIESRGDWAMRDEFPTIDGQVAPGTVSQIVNLIERYLDDHRHPEWANQWAQVYNRQGEARYAVALIHASANRLSAYNHAGFAAGFDRMAEAVLQRTGVRVGFFIDALPPDTYAPGAFRPSWQSTALFLKGQDSILGIMCFIPEVWVGASNETTLISWKRRFSSGWASTGIPFLMDVSPGYDAHIVFPGSVKYGLSLTWMNALTQMVCEFGHDGFVYNSWNGYTEGMAAVDLQEFGDVFYQWLGTMACTYAAETRRDQDRCGPQLPDAQDLQSKSRGPGRYGPASRPGKRLGPDAAQPR